MNVTKNHHIYKFELINNNLFLFIINKNTNKKNNFSMKIINNKMEATININQQKANYINIGDITKINFNKHFSLISENSNKLSHFDINYYIENNKFIPKNESDHEFIKHHWYFCGQYNPQMLFKYLLKKHENIILQKNYPKITYSEEKKNTLLFIDDRYDSSFKYLLILFLYSVGESWNITVCTTEINKPLYENDFTSLKITGRIILLENNFKNVYEYSQLLKNYKFWENIKEDNCLTFQYDSFCMGKFDNIFLHYNYIGARWPHNACLNPNIRIGNGGTSFRKTRVMETVCKKYDKKDIKKNYAEDLFFCELLYEEKLLNCPNKIADYFAFENIFNEHSIYAHQIYNTIKLDDMDHFMYRKLTNF